MMNSISYYAHGSEIVGLEMYINHPCKVQFVRLAWPHDLDHFITYKLHGPRRFIHPTEEDVNTIRDIYSSEGRDAAVQYLLTYVYMRITFES